MAIDPRKRQKKLERRKAKQRAERRELARRESRGLAARLEDAAAAPVLDCCASADLWNTGIGDVLLSRLTANGQVAFAAFLVDTILPGREGRLLERHAAGAIRAELYDKIAARSGMTAMKPECARKLVEGAVRYAPELGLPPHPDYHAAKLIFGDIAAEACTEEFTYGKDGQALVHRRPLRQPQPLPADSPHARKPLRAARAPFHHAGDRGGFAGDFRYRGSGRILLLICPRRKMTSDPIFTLDERAPMALTAAADQSDLAGFLPTGCRCRCAVEEMSRPIAGLAVPERSKGWWSIGRKAGSDLP